jgi:hypothetical protein
MGTDFVALGTSAGTVCRSFRTLVGTSLHGFCSVVFAKHA